MTAPKISLINGQGLSEERVSPLDRRIGDLAHDLTPMQEAADLPELFAGLARSITGSLNADACLVSLLDPRRHVLRDVAASVVGGADLGSVVGEYSLSDFPATAEVLNTGIPLQVSVTDPDADPAERRFLQELGFARLLMCRLMFDPETLCTIEIYRFQDRPFRHDDPGQVDVVTTFAANAYSRIQLAAKLEVHYTETIEALVSALEARDPYTEAHAGRIRHTAAALGTAMKIPLEDLRALRLGSILHDVGKIGISDSILLKPGPLTDEEWAIMRSHPSIGERMLAGIDFLSPALPIIRHHHERWDGDGYPDGLAGEDIPIGARIVSVCDAFDAMTSDRPYRRGMAVDAACEELERAAGRQFDPVAAGLLVEVVTEMGRDNLEDRFIRFAS